MLSYHEFKTREGETLVYARMEIQGVEYGWASGYVWGEFTPAKRLLYQETALLAMARAVRRVREKRK